MDTLINIFHALAGNDAGQVLLAFPLVVAIYWPLAVIATRWLRSANPTSEAAEITGVTVTETVETSGVATPAANN